MHLSIDDINGILGISLRGWDHYVKFDCPPLENMASTLSIARKFRANPNLAYHRRVLKREMSHLHQIYFNLFYFMILQQKEMRSEANYLDVTLMELLERKVKINLPSLIFKHVQRILFKNGKMAHALAYGF
ncbi:hypothetical protein FXO37_36574 [Capsicum annuum]|nr:hypothetical protein FXO37_36574 [Capsicum annuum]